jgi:PAS domain S-box-containing protein
MGTPGPKSKDEKKTKAELIAELEELRRRVREWDVLEAERERAEEALRESEETARALLNAPANVAFLIDPQGKILSFNETAVQRTHLETKELRGRSLWEILPPVVVPQRKARVNDAIQTGRPIHFDEIREPTPCENYIHPLMDAEGNVERIAVFSWSIPERRRLEEVLDKPAKKFRAVADSSPEAAFELEPGGRIIYANGAVSRKFGYKSEPGVRGSDLFGLVDVDGVGQAHLRAILEGGGPTSGEFTAKREDGYKFPVFIRAATMEGRDGKRTVRLLAADISERKRVEKALREDGDTARALAATETRFAMIIDPEGQIVALNDTSARRLVRQPDRAIGTSYLEYLPDDAAASKKRWVAEVLRVRVPLLFYDEFGGAAYENDIYPISDARGEVTRLAYFTRDVTHSKKTELELAQYRRRLERLVEERTGELTAANERLQLEAAERKRVLTELAGSEERFRLLAENFRDVLVIYDDAEERITYVNPIATGTLGLTRYDILGLKVDDAINAMVCEEDRELLLAAKAKAYVGRCAGSLEATELDFRVVRPDGELRWMRLRSYPAVSEGKPASSVFVILTDVTERKQVEDELRERAEKYHTVAEWAPFGFFIHRGGEILFANKAVREIVKYPEDDELVGLSIFDFVVAEDKERALDVIRERERGGGPYPFEVRIRCKDGEIKTVETAGRAFDYGGEPAHMVTIVDVTERKRAGQALQESEERYRLLVETSPDAIVYTDLEGKIITVNQQALTYYGAEESREMVGKNAFDFIEPGQRGRAREGLKSVLERGRAVGMEYDLAKTNGNFYRVELSTSLVRDAEGNPHGFIGVIRDVTERKEAETKLRYFSEFNRNIIESTQVGMYALYKKGVVALWNQGMERQFGVPSEEVMGRNIFEVFPALREEELGAAIIRALENGESYERSDLGHHTLKKGERVLNTKINPLRDASDAVVGAVVITEDVTEAARAEEKVKLIGELTESIVQSTRAGIYALDRRGDVQIWNKEMEKQFGVSSGELLGKNIFEAFPALREEPLGDAIARALRGGESFQGEGLKHRTLRRGERILDTKVNPVKDPTNRIVGVVVVTEDVTDE